MFPHLFQRLFAAKSRQVMQRGLATMNFTFFVVQLSSMITGWVAIAALTGPLPKGSSAFSAVLLVVAQAGTGRAILAALLLAAGGCICPGNCAPADSSVGGCSDHRVATVGGPSCTLMSLMNLAMECRRRHSVLSL
jgi:hypothetical protein